MTARNVLKKVAWHLNPKIFNSGIFFNQTLKYPTLIFFQPQNFEPRYFNQKLLKPRLYNHENLKLLRWTFKVEDFIKKWVLNNQGWNLDCLGLKCQLQLSKSSQRSGTYWWRLRRNWDQFCGSWQGWHCPASRSGRFSNFSFLQEWNSSSLWRYSSMFWMLIKLAL